MTLFPKPSLLGVKTISIDDRPRKVGQEDLGSPFNPLLDGEFSKFVDSLPNLLKSKDLKEFAAEIVRRKTAGKKVALMFGGHVIKVGLAPVLIELMHAVLVDSISMNSAAAIHDSENALFGRTSEDVEANILDGTFGMSKETGDFINGALEAGFRREDVGYGEALGQALHEREAPFLTNSVLGQALQKRIPATVHAAIGTDIVHQQPSMRGDITGEMSFRDFRLLAQLCGDLEGGVAINVGSSVIMPEVFLKAVTIARNLGIGGREMITANFDMIQHYRPQVNILERPTRPDSRFYQFIGHHELMIPLFAGILKLELARKKRDA